MVEEETSVRTGSPSSSPPNVIDSISINDGGIVCDGDGKAMACKTCRVCSDKAFGYNFNVVTCESCKAFFRRNAPKPKVGMKKEAIMSEADLARKRSHKSVCTKKESSKRCKLEPNIANESGEPAVFKNAVAQIMASATQEEQVSIPKDLLVKLISHCSTQQNGDLQLHHKTEPKECVCRCSCGALSPDVAISVQLTSVPPPTPSTNLVAQDPCILPSNDLLSETGDSSFATIMQAAIFSEVMESAGSPFSSAESVTSGSKNISASLTEREQRRLDELLAANEVMKEPLNFCEASDDHISLTDVINMTDIAIRRIIKMSKRITAFRGLCQQDQIALLKGGCTELMILRGVMAYDPSRCSWKGPGSMIKLDILKDADVKGNVYEQHIRFLSSFDQCWRNDDKVMLLLGAITLFDASRPNVTCESGIRVEQHMYYSLLKRYLECKYSSAHEAEIAFHNLSDRLAQLGRLNETVVRIFMQVNPAQVRPLLIEMFDLK